MKWKNCCDAVKKFYKKNCQLEPDRFGNRVPFREESESQSDFSSYQRERVCTRNVKLRFDII
jgi:hypothetical protein